MPGFDKSNLRDKGYLYACYCLIRLGLSGFIELAFC